MAEKDMKEMKLDVSSVSSMKVVKLFHDNVGPINSLDFSLDGELVISSSNDESIHIYSAITGKSKTKVNSKKYGVDLVRFTHMKSRVLSASNNGWDESLRYLSLVDNHYIRYFKGHRDKVVSLSMSTEDETFLSASLDQTVRLWDLRSSGCQGLVRRSGRMAAANDPKAIVFAVLSATNTISLYDKRNFDVGPFKNWQMDFPPFEWKTVEFSYDGNQLLLLTISGLVFLVDAFSSVLIQEIKPHSYPDDHIITVSFTPNAQFIFGGCMSGRVYLWQSNGKEISYWDAHDGKPVTGLKWNPKLMMMASGDTSLNLWLPQKES